MMMAMMFIIMIGMMMLNDGNNIGGDGDYNGDNR